MEWLKKKEKKKSVSSPIISRRIHLLMLRCRFNARQFTVRLGDVDLRRDDEPSSPETYHVVEVRGHKKFSRVGFYNDIAVLVLDRPVKRSKYVIPLCLPPKSARSETFVGQVPTVVGWGTTYYGNNTGTYSYFYRYETIWRYYFPFLFFFFYLLFRRQREHRTKTSGTARVAQQRL